MPRLWLDATVDDSGPSSTWRPPVPPIPEARESVDTPSYFADEPHTPTISQRRKQTMPPPLKTSKARTRKKTAARRSNAAPDVISSLVDSLATISSPANDHFEAIPSVGEARSRAHQSDLRRMKSDDSMLRDAQSAFAGFDQAGAAVIDDAAIPPVIKTAPPPSGLSPITAPKPPKESPVRTYFKTGSRTSLQSQRSSDLVNPSMDSVVLSKPTSPTDAAPPPDISRTNRHKSLKPSSSYERLRQQAAAAKAAPVNLGEDPQYLSPRKTRQRAYSPRKKHAPPPGSIVEEGQIEDVFGGIAAGKQRAKDPGLPIEGSPAVPQRQSSLLHTDGSSYASSSKASSRRRSERSDGRSHRSVSNQSDATKSTRGVTTGRIKKKESLKFEDVQDIDSEVVKRIKELKARKELREREAQLQPQLDNLPERSSSVARHARSASDPQSPLAGVDDAILVAHEHLTKGSVLQKRASTTDLSSTAARPTAGASVHQNSAQRPKTPQASSTAAEPLPINYNLVMQTLEKNQSSKPNSDRGSVKTGSSTGKTRPKSLSILGNRSGASRKQIARALTEGSSGFNSQTGSPRDSLQERRNWEETPSGKKKRWSNPIPGEVPHRSTREKVDSLVVKPVPGSGAVIEDRPLTSHSIDSIDDDVKAFIHAPRLTQKIRHPETGRTIAFSEVGDPKGHVVFCCVGMGLTRIVTAFYDELALTLKLRLITPDRPGVGESQSDPTGTPLSWPGKSSTIFVNMHVLTHYQTM